MSKKILSLLLGASALLYFGFFYFQVTPAVLDIAPTRLFTLSNLFVLLFIGLFSGLCIWLSTSNQKSIHSRTLILGCAIPILLFLPAITDLTKGNLVLPGIVLTSLVCLTLYYAVLTINLGKILKSLFAVLLVGAICSELIHTIIATNLSHLAASSLAYRTLIYGSVLTLCVSHHVKQSILSALLIICIGSMSLLVLHHLAIPDAIAAWSATMLLMALGTTATNQKGYLPNILALLISTAGGFIALTGTPETELINRELLAFTFESFVDSSLLGHGYNTLAQAVVIKNLCSSYDLNLLVLTIYETGLSGMLALALGIWLFLRNSLKVGISVQACLSRTAILVPYLVGIICAPNIFSDFVVLFSAIAIAAFLDRTSGCIAVAENSNKYNFLKASLGCLCIFSISLYSITGLFSLRSIENSIHTYNSKAIDTAYSIYNSNFKPIPAELTPLFSIKNHIGHNIDKVTNFKRIFKTKSEFNENYVEQRSPYSSLTNKILNLYTLKKGDLLFNPFPEFTRFTEVETKITTLFAASSGMALLGLEAYENITPKFNTSIDPDLMYAGLALCQNLNNTGATNKFTKLLGYTPDFPGCISKANSLQQKLSHVQPHEVQTFTSHVIKNKTTAK